MYKFRLYRRVDYFRIADKNEAAGAADAYAWRIREAFGCATE